MNIALSKFLKPAAKLYYCRFLGRDFFYMKLTVGHTLKFQRRPVDLSAITYYRNDQSFRGTEFCIGIPIQRERFTIRPTIRYMWSVNDEIPDTLYGGIIMGFAF